MRMIKGMLSVAAAACFAFGTASADMTGYSVSSDAARFAPAGGGDNESLTSLKKKGAVKIGGDLELDLNIVNRDERNNDSDDFDNTSYNTSDMDLNIRVDMTADTFLFIKLDLDDLNDSSINGGNDLLEEVNITWKNVRGSNWTVILGKDEMPFGSDVDYLITDPYTHNGSGVSYLGRSYDNGGGMNNAHLGVTESGFSHPGEIDNVFAIQAQYAYKDLAKLELAVFQNDEVNAMGDDRGMHEDNSEDSMLLRSYATRLTVTPVEGLSMQLSFANRHLDSMDDDTYGYTDGEEDSYALSFGVDYKWNSVPVEVYGEYIHGWNVRHLDDMDTDTIQVGLVWGVTEKIDLITDFEWMGIDNDTGSANIDEDLYRWSLGGCYTTDYGVKFLAEYLHEWYDSDSNWDDADADVISFRAAYSF